MMIPMLRACSVLLFAALLISCSTLVPQPAWKLAVAGDGPGQIDRIDITEPVVSDLPKSRYGNPSQYTVFGQQYTVLDSAVDFKERGVASWYGKKFHGRPTSSGEPYDMHLMTAAHKSLPLPTFVRVTRVDNGESIIVKVNDRGPFVGDRIIDLSYAAAASLGMLEAGKADVSIEALSRHEPVLEASEQTLVQAVEKRFLQVGAYSDELNAKAMLVSLGEFLELPAQISRDNDRQLFRVMIGPLQDQGSIQLAQESLSLAGIASYPVSD